MERTIISSEFKGGIWHRFFSTASKKDETLVSILDEKMRYYKLYYPFLEKKQIAGKVYEELGIPHICGDLNRKELYKLFNKERKTQCKLKEKYKKYPTLFIENKSKNKGTMKKPTIQTTPIKVNKVHTNVEKSKEDLVFDNLLSNVYPKRKEGLIQNMNLKPTKSVRFNDGIEVHSVSPSQPLYKLKPLGRLFDEPSAVRSVDRVSYTEQDLEERIEDSDSEFDADTGITSDGEEYDIEDSSHIEDHINNTETTKNEKVKENSLLTTETKTIYDSYEDDSQNTDHEISKEGNDLILSSKMMTVVQGKWVRETKQIIRNTYHTKDTMMSNRMSVNEDVDDETQEFALVRSIEHILENIKNLCISNTEKHNTNPDTISSIGRGESEPDLNTEKEQLVVGNIKVGDDCTDIEIRIQKKVCSKNINPKISLENDLSTQLIDEKLLNIENNKLSYDHDIYETESNTGEKIENRIRTKPIKLVDDIIDYINDWNSSNDGSLNHNESHASPSESIYANNSDRDKYIKQKEIIEVKNMVDDEGSSDYSLIEENSFLDKEEDNSEDLSHAEESCLDKKDDFKNLGQKENICLDEQNYSSLFSVNNNQPAKSNKSLNTKSQSIEIIKTEPPFLSNILSSTEVNKIGYETHDYLPNSSMTFSKIKEVSEEKELKINDTFACIRSMVCNRSTSNQNELYSTFCSLITKPILVQPLYVEGDVDDKHNYNNRKSLEDEESDQEKKNIQSGYSVSEKILNSKYHMDPKTQEIVKGSNEIHEKLNMGPIEENIQIMVGQNLTKNAVIRMISIDHSNYSLPGQQAGKGSGDNISKDEPQNIFDDKEKTEIFEGHIAVESETNFLSKVQVWSSHCKKYSGDVALASPNSSELASCNTDSLQKKVFDMEDQVKITDDHNNESCYSNLSNEDSFASMSNKEDNTFEESNDSVIDLDTASSTRSVTPVKLRKSNSEDVSTAYETDPETGKLVMNHYLRPLTNSTPIKLEQIDEQHDSVSKRRLYENSLDIWTLSTNSSNSPNVNKDNKYLLSETNGKQSLNTSVIEESTIKYNSQSRNENVPSESSSHKSLFRYNERNKTETNEVLSNSEKQGDIRIIQERNSKVNDLMEPSIEKVISETKEPAFEQGSRKKSSSESIIENSENESHRLFKRKKNIDKIKTIITPPICTGKQDQFVLESYTPNTDIKVTEISVTSNIQNGTAFPINQTPGNSSEQSNELNGSKKTVEFNLKTDSHSGDDILYDTSSRSEDCKFGKYTKTSTIGLEMAIEGEYNITKNGSLINENELNNGDQLEKTHHKNRLSTVSESIINNNSKVDENFKPGSKENVEHSNNLFYSNQLASVQSHSALTAKNSSPNSTKNTLKKISETTDLSSGIHETFSKNIDNKRKASVSHVTFLIRDPLSPEGISKIESGYDQPLAHLSQLNRASKMKQQGQNRDLLTTSQIETAKDTNDCHAHETLKVPNSNLLTLNNNGAHFSLGVENSHIEPSMMSSNNDQPKYLTRSKTYFSLKRKLEPINENDSGSEISLSQGRLSKKEIKINDSSNKDSAVVQYSESPVTTDNSSIEMNLKRVNTEIRRKRAKLKKENPVRKSSTSSSEDEVKKPLLKGKSFESSKLLVHKFKESNKSHSEDKIGSIDSRDQKNTGGSYSNLKVHEPKKFSSLTLPFENEARNDSYDHKVLSRQKETEHNQLSDSSSSIIYSSPNTKTAQQDNTKMYAKPKIHLDNIKKRHAEDESQKFANIKSPKKIYEKSHKSYSLYRKYDDSNKENSNLPIKASRPNNECPQKPEEQLNPRKSDPDLGQNNVAKNPHQSIKKNRKSSIVRLMGSAEAGQISNSPEVKGLLRRTYFMGNN